MLNALGNYSDCIARLCLRYSQWQCENRLLAVRVIVVIYEFLSRANAACCCSCCPVFVLLILLQLLWCRFNCISARSSYAPLSIQL